MDTGQSLVSQTSYDDDDDDDDFTRVQQSGPGRLMTSIIDDLTGAG